MPSLLAEAEPHAYFEVEIQRAVFVGVCNPAVIVEVIAHARLDKYAHLR